MPAKTVHISIPDKLRELYVSITFGRKMCLQDADRLMLGALACRMPCEIDIDRMRATERSLWTETITFQSNFEVKLGTRYTLPNI
jgi:hypothetical protein